MSHLLLNLFTELIETEAIRSAVPVDTLTDLSFAVVANRNLEKETAKNFLRHVKVEDEWQRAVLTKSATEVANRFEKVIGDNPIPASFYQAHPHYAFA